MTWEKTYARSAAAAAWSSPPFNESGEGSYDICPCCGFQFGLDDFPYEGGEGPVAEWRGRRDDGGQWRQDGGTR